MDLFLLTSTTCAGTFTDRKQSQRENISDINQKWEKVIDILHPDNWKVGDDGGLLLNMDSILEFGTTGMEAGGGRDLVN